MSPKIPAMRNSAVCRALPVLAFVLVAGTVFISCGGSKSNVTGPSATVSDLVGSWGGLFQIQETDWCSQITWTPPTQSGATVTGPLEFLLVRAKGTAAVTPSSSDISVALNFPNGFIAAPGCSITASAPGKADANNLEVDNFPLQWPAACNSSGGLFSGPRTSGTASFFLKKGVSPPRC